MNTDNTDRKKSAIWGALVADAAAVGLHWLYDQKRIGELAPESPEFRTPDPADYEGVMGFFAHGHKQPGEFSHYGEQLMVMLRSLTANSGEYNQADYQAAFQKHFGYGGDYVGYIDHPTRNTLDNIARTEHDALERARAIAFDADEGTKRTIITKVLANVKQGESSALAEKIEEAVRTTHDDDALVAYALKILQQLKPVGEYQGADDVQLPAISKLPPLVALYSKDADLDQLVESAVRVTNNNDLAVQCGYATASIIDLAIQGVDIETALKSSKQKMTTEISNLIDQAAALRTDDNLSATAKFGLSCNLVFGIPSGVHNLLSSGSYRQAVRTNILAGGDSCGRAIFVGAVLGASNGIGGETGIPQEWIEKLVQKSEIDELLNQLFG